jgi:CRISPR system Cascade subunit CasC
VFLDIHALQTLPYSNVNRDGLGSPKSCIYGGTPRIRVSSQSWKRAARLDVEAMIDSPTVRTRKIATVVHDRLVDSGWDHDEARRAGRALVHAYGLTPDDEDDDTSVLLWLPRPVIEDLAALAGEHRTVIMGLPLPELGENGNVKKPSPALKKEQENAVKAIKATMANPVTEILDRRSPTIALLGRMLADNPGHTVDGATQVAHAFTVHEAAPDFDYFTAVDDLATNSGAGHLATAEFATGTFYRYCSVNVTQLTRQLGDTDAALQLLDAWTNTFLRVIPSGKRNSTAPNTAPDLAYLSVRHDPLSLASAFEKPITSAGGYVERACGQLDSHTERVHAFVDDAGLWNGHATTVDTSLTALGTDHRSRTALVQAACNALLDHAEPQAAV